MSPMVARRAIPGDLRIFPFHLGVWEEPEHVDRGYEGGFRREVLTVIVQFLRQRGWHIGADREISTRWRSLAPRHRYGVHPEGVELLLEQGGCAIQMDFGCGGLRRWATRHRDRTAPTYQGRLRVVVEMLALATWLQQTFGYSGKLPTGLELLHWRDWPTTRTELKRREAADRWHHVCTDAEIEPYNRQSAEGRPLHLGDRVYLTDEKGRWLVGTAEHNINNMWWVFHGEVVLGNLCAHDLRLDPPAEPRRKANARQARVRLERLMHDAVRTNAFVRAEQLRSLLFGAEPVYRIRHREKGYYSVMSGGYSSSATDAGQYTAAEAEFALSRPEVFEVERIGAET
jgi:hypothetical protein